VVTEAIVTSVKPSEKQFDELIEVVRSLSYGNGATPMGLEALTSALSGDRIDQRDSFAKQVYDGLTSVASSIDNLADAIRDVGRKLG